MKIPCGDCPHVYIGQIGHRLSNRIMEHKRAVCQADFNSSAFSKHVWSAGHHIDWDNVSVLATCPDYLGPSVYMYTPEIECIKNASTTVKDTHTYMYRCLDAWFSTKNEWSVYTAADFNISVNISVDLIQNHILPIYTYT